MVLLIKYQNNNAYVEGKFIVFGSNIGNCAYIYLLSNLYVLEVTEVKRFIYINYMFLYTYW